MGLRGKSVLLLGSLLLSALLVMGVAIYYQSKKLATTELLESTGKSIDNDVIEIENFVRSSLGDLMVLAATPPIQGILRARDNQGRDPLTGDKTEYWYARLEQIFGAFLGNHPEYFQLRYLDDKGDEIVRADRTRKAVTVTPRHELQNKKDYPYFFETIRRRAGEVYYSDVNLNREHGVIQVPHAAVFRLATPIHDAAGSARGVVVINLYAEAMFSPVRTSSRGTRKFLVNQDGYFLVHPDRTREFCFDLGCDYGIKEEAQEFSKMSDLPEQLIKYHSAAHHVDGFKKIYFDPAAKNRSWAVVYEISEVVALATIYQARNTMLAVGLFIAVISLAVMTWAVTRKIVAPVLRLSATVARLEAGDLGARVREDGLADEIGDLAASTNRMAGIIQQDIAEITLLNRITVAASSSLAIDEIARKTLDALLQLQLLRIEKKAAIFVADATSRTLRLVASRGFSAEQKALDAVVPFGDCLCGRVAATGETIYSENCCGDPNHTRRYADITPHGHLVVPLKSGDRVLGVMALYLAAGTKMAPDESRIYLAIADVLAVSLQNALNFANSEQLKGRLGLILNSLGEGLYELDSDGICTFMNPTAERLLGYESGELTGTRLHAITHHTRPDGSAYPREECRIYAAFKHNTVQHVDDEVFWRKDGSGFPVEYSSTPIRDEIGAAIGAVVVFSDITERRRAEAGIRGYAEQYQAMLSAAIFGFWLADESGRLLDVNDAYCAMSGYTREELLNLSVSDLEIIENPEDTARHIRKIIEIGIDHFESRHKAKDGRVFDVEISTTFWHSQRKFVVFISDITERKKMDVVLKGYSESLEREVAERTKQIEDASKELQVLNEELALRRDEAEAATRAKSDFLANMSHELRTPLNSILGFSEILRDGLPGEVNTQQKEYLNDVWESGKHLLGLINDILDISKIEAGKMELEIEEFDLHVLLGEALVFFREKASRHRISLHHEAAQEPLAIMADERKIKQVVINLLANAIKFTPDGGEVGVCSTRQGGEVQVSVWDTGIGIAPEDLGKLFQPFQQLESASSKKYQGTGLGLNLCRKIVELHAGRIQVESTPGQGSRFTFSIPIAGAAEKSSSENG